MAKSEKIKVEMSLKNIIAESREVAQALNELADNLERIEKKYAEPLRADIEKQIKFYAFSEEKWVAHKNDGIKIALGLLDRRLKESDAE